MAVGWHRPRDDDAEPTTPSTRRIVTGVGIDPSDTGAVGYARASQESIPFAAPDVLQDDVIEPTAIFKPWLGATDWDSVEITVMYYD